jgi:anti-anti-sigma factor
MLPFKITVVKKQSGVFCVSVFGPIDQDTYASLEEKVTPFLESSTKVIILDMKEVDYISSAGISTILKINNTLKANNGTLIIVNLQPQVEKVFEIIKSFPAENIISSIKELDDYLISIQRKEIERRKSF